MTDLPEASPHGDIEAVDDGVYWVQGTVRMGPGVRISRNMAIVVEDGALTLINAVRLDARGEARLAELGAVKHVVKIGYFHGMDDAYYVAKHGAAYWTLPNGGRKRDPKPTETLSAEHLPFRDARLFAFEQTKFPEGAILVKRGGGALITCDAVQNWPDTSRCSVPAKLLTYAMGFTRRPAQIGPPWRKGMTPPGGSLKADFERLAELPFEKLLAAHGGPLESGAQAALKATIAATYG